MCDEVVVLWMRNLIVVRFAFVLVFFFIVEERRGFVSVRKVFSGEVKKEEEVVRP